MCWEGQAAACPKGSIERMVEVVAFSVSPYASCRRPKRSFDPLLSETYELVHPDKGIRLISEHVSRVLKLSPVTGSSDVPSRTSVCEMSGYDSVVCVAGGAATSGHGYALRGARMGAGM